MTNAVIVVCAIVVLVCGGVRQSYQRTLFIRDSLAARIDIHEIRLRRLIRRYNALYWFSVIQMIPGINLEIDERIKTGIGVGDEVNYLAGTHIRKYGGDISDKRPLKFGCGSSYQLASILDACDGVNDCDNGYDESPTVCTNPLAVGSKWDGHVVYNNCRRFLNIDWPIVTIDSVHHRHWFPAVLQVNATVDVGIRSPSQTIVKVMAATGTYTFARRTLTLQMGVLDNSVTTFSALFDGTNWDRFVAHILRYSDGEPCAEYRFFRK